MWYLCLVFLQKMHFRDAISITLVPSLQILSCHVEFFWRRRTTSHEGITKEQFLALHETIVVNQPFLVLFIKSVFFSHHSAHYLNQQGCQHLMLVVRFVERVSRGFSPTWHIIWHVNCTTCHVSMQQQQWRPPLGRERLWTPLMCCKAKIIALCHVWGLHFMRAVQR